jgi:hypothetical protein
LFARRARGVDSARCRVAEAGQLGAAAFYRRA